MLVDPRVICQKLRLPKGNSILLAATQRGPKESHLIVNFQNHYGRAILGTPWKINMEHINHPFRKENDLPNLHDYVPC